MARGWESKSVESQQVDAAERKRARPALTDEQRHAAAKRRTLELSRARLADDLSRATAPQHRQMLERALADIDASLQSLS
jgi:hypothetical protein